MKKLLLILLLGLPFASFGQLVLTVAGVVDSIGANNGFVFDATFNNPHGIASDGLGNVYVADRYNHVIRKITPGGNVSTLAGVVGQTGMVDGGFGIGLMNEPWAICADSLGNVYVADTKNNSIRKIDLNQEITTIAGTGNFGTSDGPSNLATFGNPTGIEISSEGFLYIADHLTHIIRKIDTNGFVTTLAGIPYVTGSSDGQGNQASFHRPYGLTIDCDGNIIVADEWNHKIRKVTPDGLVTTVAGSGLIGAQDGVGQNTSFNYPWDVTCDNVGNIYVADGYNYIIRKIDPQGNVSDFAGSVQTGGATDGVGNAATFNGATAIDYSSFTGELFVGDAYNQLIRKIVLLNQGIIINTTTGQTEYCPNEAFTVSAFPTIFSFYRFYINGSLEQEGTESTFDVSGLTPGFYIIKVEGQDASGTFISSEVQVQIFPPTIPSITVIGDLELGPNDSVTFVSSETEDLIWSDGSTNPVLNATQAGTYYVSYTNEFGCVGTSDSIVVTEITINEAPQITVDVESSFCEGDSTILISSLTENVQWLKDGWEIEGATLPELQVMEAGLYQVQIETADGVILLSDPIVIQVFSLPEIAVETMNNSYATETNIEVNVNGAFESLSINVEGIDEVFTSSPFEISFNQPGLYDMQIEAVSAEGCVSERFFDDQFQIVADANLFVPTAFSPNGDDHNDVFKVRGAGILDGNMMIFNQWGNMLFETSDVLTGWDGNSGGSPVLQGTYVYLIEIETVEGKQTLKGHITLLK